MKLVTYDGGNGPRLGAVVNGSVIDLADESDGDLPSDMLHFLQMGDRAMDLARAVVADANSGQPLDDVHLLAPIQNPSKVVAIGNNYMDHCREQNVEPPSSPIIFTKFTTSIVGPGDEIRWDRDLSQQVDYECELAVIIGKMARNISEDEVFAHVGGYTVCNDVSARDLQFSDGQWVRGKSLDTFCPLGPQMVTADEISDPHNLAIRCHINGETLQDSNTRELIFNIPQLISYCSRAFTLLPGDIIATGTPHGVGHFRSPRRYLRHGDEVTCEVEGIGSLVNRCVEERSA